MSFKCVVNGRVTEWLSGICCLIVCRLKATGYRLPLLISEATSKAEKERWLDRKANRLDDKLYVHLSNSNLCTFYERWVGSVYDKIWPDLPTAHSSLDQGPDLTILFCQIAETAHTLTRTLTHDIIKLSWSPFTCVSVLGTIYILSLTQLSSVLVKSRYDRKTCLYKLSDIFSKWLQN